MNIDRWYVLYFADKPKMIKKSPYHKDAIAFVRARQYMMSSAEDIYDHWIKALETKNEIRSIRWWDWIKGELVFSPRPLGRGETYVSLLISFLYDGSAGDILLTFIDMSLNAREKIALERGSLIYRMFKERQQKK